MLTFVRAVLYVFRSIRIASVDASRIFVSISPTVLERSTAWLVRRIPLLSGMNP